MKIGIIPCQGACNSGMMTHKIALEFVDNKKINMVCSLGIPLGIDKIVNMAKTNDKFISLNGCPIKCSSLTLDKIGITDYNEFILTSDFNIEKNKNYNDETNIDKVREAVKKIIDDYLSKE